MEYSYSGFKDFRVWNSIVSYSYLAIPRLCAAMAAPTHRIRSKSRPKSPDPKALKKAAKASKNKTGLVTPPPKPANLDASSASSKGDVKRRLKFGPDTITTIHAENPAGDKKPGDDDKKTLAKADKIIQSMKQELPGSYLHTMQIALAL